MKPLAVAGAVAAAALAVVAVAANRPASTQPAAPDIWWAGYASAGRLVALPDGRSLYLYCDGDGGPVVVMDSGTGDDASSWRKVQHQIAVQATTRVCVYDRAGYGRSTGSAGPRDTRAEVSDLEHLLQAANLPGPYVLVGHSMGGFNVRLFASRHLQEVAGIVLVDPTIENQATVMYPLLPNLARTMAVRRFYFRACASLQVLAKHCRTGPPPDDLPPVLAQQGVGKPTPGYFSALNSEQDAFFNVDSGEVAAEKRPLGATPLIVLTAADTWKPGASPSQIEAANLAWSSGHDAIAALSTRGVNRRIEGSSHSIQRAKPQAVVDAVDSIVRTARGQVPPGP